MSDDPEKRVANAERALEDAEERHARELAEVTRTMHTYLRVVMNECAREGFSIEVRKGRLTLSILQDHLREYANGPALSFEVDEDGETLRISEVPDPERSAP